MSIPNPFAFLSSLSQNNKQSEGEIEVSELTIRFEHMTLAVQQIARVQLLVSALNPLWPALFALALLAIGASTSSPTFYSLFVPAAAYAAFYWWMSLRKYVAVSSSDGATFSIVTRSAKFQNDVYQVLKKKMNEPHVTATIDMSRKSIVVNGDVGRDIIMGNNNG